MTHKHARLLLALTVAIAGVSGLGWSVADDDKPAETKLAETKSHSICLDSAMLFRAARGVISDSQDLINDASKGDKGLTGDTVIAAAKVKFEKAAGRPLPEGTDDTVEGRSRAAMLAAIKEVMTQAQPLINEPGKAFKGFLPAVFAKQVADSFSKTMDGTMSIKLTAPKAYIRNRSNRPDTWEDKVIESTFKGAGYEKGKPFAEVADANGKKAYRLIIPEYYAQSCLACHGDKKGDKDITGGIKEGAKLDELGGAISVLLYEGAQSAAATEK